MRELDYKSEYSTHIPKAMVRFAMKTCLGLNRSAAIVRNVTKKLLAEYGKTHTPSTIYSAAMLGTLALMDSETKINEAFVRGNIADIDVLNNALAWEFDVNLFTYFRKSVGAKQ